MAKRQIQNASGESPSESDSEEARQPKRQCQQATTTISTAGLSNQVIPEPTQSDSEPAIGVAAYPTLDTWEVEPLTSPEVSPKSTPQPSPQPSLSRPPTPQASSPPSFPQLPFWADFDADIDEFARTELDPPDLLDRTLAWHQSGYAPELHPYPYVWISYVWYMFIEYGEEAGEPFWWVEAHSHAAGFDINAVNIPWDEWVNFDPDEE